MIFQSDPSDWKDLERKTAQIFREMGWMAEVEKEVETVRGAVVVDIYALDNTTSPYMVYICECKSWRHKVPKHVVHSFRTVVADLGANAGFLISAKGFQSGAKAAAGASNIHLYSWEEFQLVFFERWRLAMTLRLAAKADQIFKRFDTMSDDETLYHIVFHNEAARKEYQMLAGKFSIFTMICIFLVGGKTDLPLPVTGVDPRGDIECVSNISFANYRELFDVLLPEADRAMNLMDEFLAKHSTHD